MPDPRRIFLRSYWFRLTRSSLSLTKGIGTGDFHVHFQETLRHQPAAQSADTLRCVSFKTNLLVRVTDAGLRARATPAVSLEDDFER